MKKILITLAIGVGFAILGHILAGCDNGGNTDEVFGVSDSGSNVCDDASKAKIQVSDTVVQGKSIPAPEYVQQLCAAQSEFGGSPDAASCMATWSKYIMTKSQIEANCQQFPDVESCVTSLTYSSLTKSQVEVECSTKMTLAECADAAHGYVDAAGVKHMLGVGGSKSTVGYVSSFGRMGDCSAAGTVPVCYGSVYVGETCLGG